MHKKTPEQAIRSLLRRGGVGGIRTLGTLMRYTRFPIVLVMAASIPLHRQSQRVLYQLFRRCQGKIFAPSEVCPMYQKTRKSRPLSGRLLHKIKSPPKGRVHPYTDGAMLSGRWVRFPLLRRSTRQYLGARNTRGSSLRSLPFCKIIVYYSKKIPVCKDLICKNFMTATSCVPFFPVSRWCAG